MTSTPDRPGLVRGTTGAMSFNSFTSLISQTTPAEERRVREQQHQLEAAVAQRVRRAMLAEQKLREKRSDPSAQDSNGATTKGKAVMREVSNAMRSPFTFVSGGSDSVQLTGASAQRSPAEGGRVGMILSAPQPSTPPVSPGPTFTTLGGSTGNVVPSGYTETDGMLVCLEALKTVQSRKKNASPFDANKYYPMLPPPEGAARSKILLCLDIDETMLHSTAVAPTNPATPRADVTAKYDVRVPVETPDGSEFFIGVNVRPFLREFIEAVSPLFDIAIFTASQSNYANLVLQAIDRDRKLFGPVTKRLFREHCAESNGCRVKDLSLLGRPLDRVVLLDNSPATYSFQPRNAIPISSYFEGGGDNELQKLLPLMRRLASAKSVYSVLDPYNAFLITPEPDEVLTMASPLSTSPVSLCRSSSFHSPRGTKILSRSQSCSLISVGDTFGKSNSSGCDPFEGSVRSTTVGSSPSGELSPAIVSSLTLTLNGLPIGRQSRASSPRCMEAEHNSMPKAANANGSHRLEPISRVDRPLRSSLSLSSQGRFETRESPVKGRGSAPLPLLSLGTGERPLEVSSAELPSDNFEIDAKDSSDRKGLSRTCTPDDFHDTTCFRTSSPEPSESSLLDFTPYAPQRGSSLEYVASTMEYKEEGEGRR